MGSLEQDFGRMEPDVPASLARDRDYIETDARHGVPGFVKGIQLVGSGGGSPAAVAANRALYRSANRVKRRFQFRLINLHRLPLRLWKGQPND
jgi:hypothetical protein